MSNELAVRSADIVERVVVAGDLAKLSPMDRVDFYRMTCESLGLNPITRPFDYIQLSGKLTLYARKECSDQLRKQHRISLSIVSRDTTGDGTHVVVARAETPEGRRDEDIGSVFVGGLKGEAMANAMMKAVTKAKRRVTLSICGLGFLDESEIHSIGDAKLVDVNYLGEITTETTGPNIKPAQNPTPPVAPAWPELPALAEIKTKLAAMVTAAAVSDYWQSLRLDNEHPRFAEIRDVFSDARRRIEAAKAAPAPSQPTPPPYDTESAEFLLESMPTAAERDAWLRDEKVRMKWADADPIYTALRNVVAEMAKKEAPPAKREPMNAAPGKAATRESLAAAGFDGKNPTPFDDDLEAIE